MELVLVVALVVTVGIAVAAAAGAAGVVVRSSLQRLLATNRELAEHQRSLHEQALDTRHAAIDEQVRSMSDQLGRVTDLVQLLDRAQREKHGRLDETLHVLTSTTRSLHEALASPKARGQWGERTADDLLRLLGLQEGVAYEKQRAVEGGRSVPDFTFFLPDGRLLHMDVKFPIDAYLRHLEADTDAERDRQTVEFLRAVRARVRELRGRDYIDPERGTVDHVLCFVPNEAVYGFICDRGPDVVDEALRERVVLCSPMSLYAVLSVIRQATELLAVERTSDDVLRLLGAFDKQWAKFCESLDKVGRSLGTAQKAFDELSGTRRRQLEKPLDELDAIRRQRSLPVARGYDDDSVVPFELRKAAGDDDAW